MTRHFVAKKMSLRDDGSWLRPVFQAFTSSYGPGRVTSLQSQEQPQIVERHQHQAAVTQETNTASVAKTRVAIGFNSHGVLDFARALQRQRMPLPLRAVNVLFVAGPRLFRARIMESQNGMSFKRD